MRKDLPDEAPSAYKDNSFGLHLGERDDKSATFFHSEDPSGVRPFLSHATKDFGTVVRGDPVPATLEGEARAAAGLTEDTWTLSVTADDSIDPPHVKIPAELETPLLLDLSSLKELGRKHGTVKVVKAMQCLNIDSPLGQGLWEGVPLATVLRAAGRHANIRRVNYWVSRAHTRAVAQILIRFAVRCEHPTTRAFTTTIQPRFSALPCRCVGPSCFQTCNSLPNLSRCLHQMSLTVHGGVRAHSR